MPEPQDGSLVKFALRPDQLKVGTNEVGLRLGKRSARAEDDIIVDAVEIHLDYESRATSVGFPPGSRQVVIGPSRMTAIAISETDTP